MPSSETARRRRARLVTALLAWGFAVCAATAIGLTAVGAIGDGIMVSGQRPLTPQEVQARLIAASAAARPAPPAPTGAVSLVASAASEALTSPGGAVLARCRRWWSTDSSCARPATRTGPSSPAGAVWPWSPK